MIRGTTPKISINLPMDASLVAEIWLTLSQRSQEVLTITKSRMAISGNSASVVLTQKETLSLDDDCMVDIQARIRTTSGEALASRVKRYRVEEILKDGEI